MSATKKVVIEFEINEGADSEFILDKCKEVFYGANNSKTCRILTQENDDTNAIDWAVINFIPLQNPEGIIIWHSKLMPLGENKPAIFFTTSQLYELFKNKK